MKQRALFLIVMGAFLGGAISQAVSRQVSASPADVFGSPNVAIDTYRNSRGTYVLWSNGRITSAEEVLKTSATPIAPPTPRRELAHPASIRANLWAHPTWRFGPFLAAMPPMFSSPTAT